MTLELQRTLLTLMAALILVPGITLRAQPIAPSSSLVAPQGEGEEACNGTVEEGWVILDDGTAETGYGWVPSVIEGEFVQRFSTTLFPTRDLESVCICWIRTTADDDIDFEVVFYGDVDGQPAPFPYAVVSASSTVEPKGITESFTEVDVRGVRIPVGPSYIGARWNASVDRFFFVCADSTEGIEPVEVFFRDDRAEGEWASVLDSLDPIFRQHRALMVRGRSSFATALDVPTLGVGGLAMLVVLLAGVASRLLRRHR